MLKYLLFFLVALVLSDRLTVLVARLARRLGFVDTPSERRLHRGVIPRPGGVALVIAFFATAFAFTSVLETSAFDGAFSADWLFLIAPGAAVLVITGLLDDVLGLSPRAKLYGQTTACLLIFIAGISLQNISVFLLPLWADIPLTVLFLLTLINAFNLIDGLDGLAAGLAAIATVGLIGLSVISSQPLNSLVLLAFLGAIVGFLRHNFHPASVFLGDTGAMFLGFMIGVFALESSFKTSTVTALAIPLLAFGVPLIDTLLAIWRRSVRRLLTGAGGLSEADMDHLHHRLVRLGLSHRKVAYILYVFGAVLVSVGLMSVMFQSKALGIYLVSFSVCAFIIIRHFVHIELWDTGRVIMKGLPFPKYGFLASAFYPLFDIVALSVTFIVAYSLTVPSFDYKEFRSVFVSGSPLWVGSAFCAVALARTYYRVWSRARVTEYVYLVGSLLFGVVFAAGLQGLVDPFSLLASASFVVLFYGIGGAALTGMRALPRVVRDIMALCGEAASQHGAPRSRVLLVGTNIDFLRNLKRPVGEVPFESTVKIIGFLDRNRNLRHRFIYGYPVLGTLEEAERVVSDEFIDEVVITEDLQGEELRNLLALASKARLIVRRWTLTEAILAGQEILSERRITAEAEGHSRELPEQDSEKGTVPSEFH